MLRSLWPFGGRPKRSVPLKTRLRAWWEGYDLDALAHARRRRHGNKDDAAGEDAFDAMFEAEKKQAQEWSDTRKAIVQDLWTPGFIVPGGSEYVEHLVNGCGLTAAETMLEMGVGMAGGTRAIIDRFGNYVTGYESDSNLAAEARKFAVTYDFDSKFEVVNANPGTFRPKAHYFRAALLRDVLYTVREKEDLISRVANSLKQGESQIIITDLMFEDDPDSPELERWMVAEPGPVYPWSLGALKKCLSSLKVAVRTAEDESDIYRRMVIGAWKEYLSRLNGENLSPEVGRQIVHEAEFWARRLAAIDAGVLHYVRAVGVVRN
jgi:hypothetical protein